ELHLAKPLEDLLNQVRIKAIRRQRVVHIIIRQVALLLGLADEIAQVMLDRRVVDGDAIRFRHPRGTRRLGRAAWGQKILSGLTAAKGRRHMTQWGVKHGSARLCGYAY